MSHTNLEINVFDNIHFYIFHILVPNCSITPSLGFVVPKGISAPNYVAIIAIVMSNCFI